MLAHRKLCMDTYGLDPAWYYTAPCLFWAAVLKRSGVSLDQLTSDQYDIYDSIIAAKFGGIVAANTRHIQANCPLMPERPRRHIDIMQVDEGDGKEESDMTTSAR